MNVPKTESEQRVTETVFAKVCLPLIQDIIFCIMLVSFFFFLRKENSLIRTDKSPCQILPQRSKRFNQLLKLNSMCRQPNLLT